MAKDTPKIHEIVKYPDPVLAKPAAPITVFDAALKKLVADMFESMYAAQGIGLAAPGEVVSWGQGLRFGPLRRSTRLRWPE